ncbi:hypothetical protein L596_009332 [Steinernema carpocapsae]|uniref:Uncharacterized protein n=1 Tax=Steinernema carpocapsae TaxID=34508 RepID=A0A4U5PFB6_STECR|nr:hypothetical protein L596_009332 [Steinernema carpocapsae]
MGWDGRGMHNQGRNACGLGRVNHKLQKTVERSLVHVCLEDSGYLLSSISLIRFCTQIGLFSHSLTSARNNTAD